MTHAQLTAAGFPVSAEVHARLACFVAALLEENQKLNLTAIREPAAAWALHVCDSLALLPLLDAAGAKRLIDVGAGGGVPGIPLACARPSLHVTLLDATRKKVDASIRIATATGVRNVAAIWGRAERLAEDRPHRAAYDALVARAVGKLPKLLPACAGLLRANSIALFPKSNAAAAAEIAAATSIAARLRLVHVETRPYALPAPHGERCIVIYRRD